MMILTQKMIAMLRFQGLMAIDDELETSLLSEFGVELYHMNIPNRSCMNKSGKLS